MSNLSLGPLGTSTLASRTVVARRIAAVCGTGVLLLGAAACGSSGGTTNAAAGTGSTNAYGGSGQTSQQGGQQPGANGKVAAVSGSTAQVQSNDGQVAVSWTSSTTFTKQVSAKLADVEVGDCVMVTSADQSTTAPTPGSTPTQATEVTAGSVRITAATNGTCTPAGGQGRGPQANQNGDAPQGAPEGTPQGNAEGGAPPAQGSNQGPGGTGRGQFRGGFGGGTFGTVKAVSTKGFTVTSSFPGAASGSTATKTEVAVTVTGTTTYTTTAKGAAADVKVGSCLRADGKADDTGAIAATRVQLTTAVDGECATTFARFGGQRSGGAASGSSGSTAQAS